MLAVRYWVDEDVILRVWVLPSYSVGRMQCVLLKFKVPMASMTVRNVVNKTCPNETQIVETILHLSLAITCHRIASSKHWISRLCACCNCSWKPHVARLVQLETLRQHAA